MHFLLLILAVVSEAKAADLPIHDAVYNGRPVASTGQGWRSTARLSFTSGKCTGVFIDRDLILTAAHCGELDGSGELEISLFEENSSSSTDLTIAENSYRLYRSPGFRKAAGRDVGRNDLALIVLLDESLPTEFSPTEFLTSDVLDGVAQGQEVYMVGSGITETGYSSDRLYFTKGSLEAYLPNSIMKVRVQANQGICGGDSGSPLFAAVNGKLYLSSLVYAILNDINNDCGSSVYATVIDQARYDWIMKKADEARNGD